jgi:hypothetical protein
VDPRASTYVPLASRASLAKVLLLLAGAIHCAAAFTSFGLLHLADEAGQTGAMAVGQLEAAENRHALVETLQIAVYLIAGASFIRWFHRAYANLPSVGVERLRHRAGWAVGAWFVPIAALFWPKRIADEIWRGSDPDTAGSASAARVTPVYGAWWRTFVVGAIFVALGSNLWGRGATSLDLELAALLQLVGNLLGVAAAVLAYLVVDRTSERQQARAAKLAVWQAAPQA